MKKLDEMIASKVKCLDELQNMSESLEKRMVFLQDSIFVVKKQKAKVENQIRYQDSMVQKNLIQLQNCRDNIQNPSNLKNSVKRLATSLETLPLALPNQNQNSKENFNGIDESGVKENEMILKKLTYELDSLKAEDASQKEKNRQEKAEQITANMKLLDKLSKKRS